MKLSAGGTAHHVHVEPDAPEVQLPFRNVTPLAVDPPRCMPQSGIKILMQAVLEEAIRQYLGTHPRLRAEAEQWMVSARRTTPFAFSVVCETLGLAPSAVRVALRRLRENRLTARSFRRTRPHAGRRALRDRAQLAG